MAEHSYGFRAGRGAKDALLKAGHGWVVDADLKSYFDTIPHERLLALVKERVGEGRVLALVESFLRAGRDGRSARLAAHRAGQVAVR